MEKRYGLDTIRYLTDVAGQTGQRRTPFQALTTAERISLLTAHAGNLRRELAQVERELRALESSAEAVPEPERGFFRRLFQRFMAQES